MYKLLVVEDNEIIRNSLVARVAAMPLPIEIAGQAPDGAQGFEEIKRLHPDIVLTDIKMPVADAFYMVERCHTQFPNIRFIIISGYDDFEYLKKSIQFSVVNYLLKPVDEEELEATLRKTIEQIRAQKREQACLEAAEHVCANAARERNTVLIQEFFAGNRTLEDTMNALVPGFTFSEAYYYGVFAWNTVSPVLYTEVGPDSASLSVCAEAVARLFINGSCVIARLYNNLFVGCVAAPERDFVWGARQHHAVSQVLSDTLARSDVENLCSYVGFSDKCTYITLRPAFENALENVCARFVVSKPNDIRQRNAAEAVGRMDELQMLLRLQSKKDRRMQSAMLALQIADAVHLGGEPTQMIALMQLLLESYPEQDAGISLVNEARVEYQLLQFHNFAAFRDAVGALARFIGAGNSERDISDEVLRYIDANYMKPINVAMLAEMFHLSTIYLGKLIKKKAGEPFNSYINKLRIEQAKVILRTNPDVLIKDLAYALGYADSQYFTKVFKQKTGVSPSEFASCIHDRV